MGDKNPEDPFRTKNQGKTTPRTPPYCKYYAVVNLLCVVHLLSHSDLLSRRTLCGHHFPGNCRHFSSQRSIHSVLNLGGVVKTLRRSNSLSRSRSVFSRAGAFGQRATTKGQNRFIPHSNRRRVHLLLSRAKCSRLLLRKVRRRKALQANIYIYIYIHI